MRFEETVGLSHDLGVVAHEMHQAVDAGLKPLRLSTPQYSALSVLEGHPALTNAELARRCFVAAQTMNRLLQSLEKRGLVKKTANPEHALKFDYRLTAKGTKLICEAHVLVNRVELVMIEGLPKKEIAALKRTMSILLGNLSRAVRGGSASGSGAGHQVPARD